VVAQVGDHRHPLDARAVAGDDEVAADVEVERQGRAVAAFAEGEAADDVLGQHRDLVARHVHRGQPLAGDGVEGGFAAEADARRGDVDADAPAGVGGGDREGVVDLGGGGVVDGEGAHRRQRQIGGLGGCLDRREAGAGREVFEQEAVEVQLVGGRQRAAVEQQAGGDLPVSAQAASRALVSRRLRSGL
jgi:hypothetical protein